MEHSQELIQSHDRMLVTLTSSIKTLEKDISEIKLMVKGLNSEHRTDNNGIYDRINTNNQWTHEEIKKMQVEIAVIKTKLIMMGIASGAISSGLISLVVKLVGG